MLPASVSGRVLPFRPVVACNFKSAWNPGGSSAIRFIRFVLYYILSLIIFREHPKISKGVRAHSVAGLLEERRNKSGGPESRSGAAESASVAEIHHGDERKFQLRQRHQRTVVPQPAPSYQTGSLFQQGSASSSIPSRAIVPARNSYLSLTLEKVAPKSGVRLQKVKNLPHVSSFVVHRYR